MTDQQIGETVLVIEDNLDHARAIEIMLGGTAFASFAFEHRTSLETATAFLAGPPPALILLDLHLPDARGLPLLANVRRAVPHVPIVVLTARDDDDLAADALSAGAQDYLVKGAFDTKGLARAIRHALARQQLVADLEHARSREAQRATHDALTGLPNRVLFFDRLERALERSRRACSRFALVFVDLNGFKEVNDGEGHAVGDEILCEVATRLTTNARASDTVARLGGDEFTILYEGTADRAVAEALVQGLHAKFAEPMMIAGRSYAISISAGLAVYPDDGEDARALLQVADAAMYDAKKAGRGDARRGGVRSPAAGVARATGAVKRF